MSNELIRVEFAEPNKWVKELNFAKTTSGYQEPYGRVNVYFHESATLDGFDASALIKMGGFCTNHITEKRLGVVFYDKNKDPYGAVDHSIALIAERFQIAVKKD